MKKLFINLAFILIPVGVVVLLPLVFLYYSGELTPIEKVAELLENKEKLVIFGTAYSESYVQLKLISTIRRQPEVLVLGSSRTLQFRDYFFRDDVKFYNAGKGIVRLRDFSEFLSRIPKGSEPKTLIIGLEQDFFNDASEDLSIPYSPDIYSEETKPLQIYQKGWKHVYIDLVKGKFYAESQFDAIKKAESNSRIGFNAIINDNGLRNDGSQVYGAVIKNPDDPNHLDYQYRDTFQRVDTGTRRFEYGQQISQRALKILDDFLLSCQNRGIHVVAFTPPYAPAVYQKMLSMSDKFSYLAKIEPAVTPIFDRYGFQFYDGSDATRFGSFDAEMFDGFHGSEKTYLRLYLEMLKKSPQLQKFSEELELQNKLDSSNSNFIIRENLE